MASSVIVRAKWRRRTNFPLIIHNQFEQPKQVEDIKTFLTLVRRADAKSVAIKKAQRQMKFKLRTSKYLLTLVVKDLAKANKLKSSFPPSKFYAKELSGVLGFPILIDDVLCFLDLRVINA